MRTRKIFVFKKHLHYTSANISNFQFPISNFQFPISNFTSCLFVPYKSRKLNGDHNEMNLKPLMPSLLLLNRKKTKRIFRKLLQTSLFLIGICFLSCTNIMSSTGSYNAVEELNELTPPEQNNCMGVVIGGPSSLVNIDTLRNPKSSDWCTSECCEGCCTCDCAVEVFTPCTLYGKTIVCGTPECLHEHGIYFKNDPQDKPGLQPKRAPGIWYSLFAGGAFLIAGLNQPRLLSDCDPTSDDPYMCENMARTALIAAGSIVGGMSLLYYTYRFILDRCRT